MSEPAAVPGQPARVLGTFDATCIVIGAIIGVGIFFTPKNVVEATGDGGLALLAWGIAGFIALCGALVFAELGTRYSASGAQYQVLRDAYGPCPAFLFVFCNATAIQTGAIAIIAAICAQNLITASGGEESNALTSSDGDPRNNLVVAGLAFLLILGVIVANAIGVKWGSRIQNLTVIAKVLTLLVIAALAVIWGNQPVLDALPIVAPDAAADAAPHASARLTPFLAVMAALVPAFFSYGGWQHALWISGEVRDPQRNLPRAIVGGVLLVVAVYVLMAWATLRLLGVQGVSNSGVLAADAVGVVSPHLGKQIVAGAVAVSAFGVLNAQLLSGPRLLYGMARDGRFFRVFSRLSPRGTPVAAILLIGLIAVGLLGLMLRFKDAISTLLSGVVLIDGAFFALTGAALMVLRRRERRARTARTDPGTPAPPATRAFRVPAYPLIPILFVLGEVGVVIGAHLGKDGPSAALFAGIWIGGAAIVYAIWFRSPVRAGA